MQQSDQGNTRRSDGSHIDGSFLPHVTEIPAQKYVNGEEEKQQRLAVHVLIGNNSNDISTKILVAVKL